MYKKTFNVFALCSYFCKYEELREFGIRKFSRNLVIWDYFCTFICDYQLLIKN